MTDLQYTPIEEIANIRDELKAGFASGKLRPIEYRKYQLAQLMYALHDNSARLDETLRMDLGRPVLENRFLELFPSITEILTQYNNVQKWSKPEKPPFNLNWTPLRPVVKKEPKGTVLIINAFNYPIWLTFVPLAGAIAAGCTVVIKPSEQTPASSGLLTELLHKYLDNDLVRVVNGGVAETTKLLELQWDHIMYTGSGWVGKIVSEAAAKHLTPITLELGGKSPVIVDPKCDLKTTANRILWGKFVNGGQTCTAPDYILVPREFQDALVKAFEEAYAEFYPDGDPSKPGALTHVITQQAAARIGGLLANTKGKVIFGGTVNEANRYVAPTVVRDVAVDDSLMSQEIFGPVLSIVPIESLDSAIKFVQERPDPLVVYLFTQDQELKTKVYTQTRSGAFVVNDTILHSGAEGLPFGGIGPSGYGAYTGKFTFDTFTHLKACLDSPSWIDRILYFRYPPYTDKKLATVMKFVKSLPARPKGPPAEGGNRSWWGKGAIVALAMALAALMGLRK